MIIRVNASMVPAKGLEPLRRETLDPKSSASANSARPACCLAAFYYTLDAEAVVKSATAYIYEKLMAKTSVCVRFFEEVSAPIP